MKAKVVKVIDMPETVLRHRVRHEAVTVDGGQKAEPQPQPIPENQGRVVLESETHKSTSSNLWIGALLVLIALLCVAVAVLGYDRYSSRSASAETTVVVAKTQDRIVDQVQVIRSAAPQQVAEAQQPARANPAKEKYLADCAARGAPVTQSADGILNCNAPSSVTHNGGVVVTTLANARTLAEFKQACAAIRGARYTEQDGRPNCAR